MIDRPNQPLSGSKSDITPVQPERADLLTNWPEHVDLYLQYVKDVMRSVGAPMGLQADLVSLQGRIREQRRPGRLEQLSRDLRGQSMAYPAAPSLPVAPPMAPLAPAGIETVQPSATGSVSAQQAGPVESVRMNLPDGMVKEIPIQFRTGMSNVEESDSPRDLS